MNGLRVPNLAHEHILRTAMLEAMNENMHDYAVFMHDGFSDGIIQGCLVEDKRLSDQTVLTVGRGLVHFAGEVWYLRDPVTIPYEPTNVWHIIKMRFCEPVLDDGCHCRQVKIVNVEGDGVRDDELELCRFKLKSGSRLRRKYVNFDDYITEFDTVNILNVPYAAKGYSILAPEILSAFAREAMQNELSDFDKTFVIRAMDEEHPLTREALAAYISLRNNVKIQKLDEFDNVEAYQMLTNVLNEMRAGGARKVAAPKKRKKNVLID